MAISKLRFLFFFVFFLGYSQAVVEVNTDTIKNTWGDEYDNYVHAKNTETQNVNANDHHTDLGLSFASENFQICPLAKSSPSLGNSEFNPYSSKIFLKNCSFLI